MKTFLTGNRAKSFYWRTGMMILAAILASITESLTTFGLETQYVVVLGLILAEISKYLNNELSSHKPGI